jgi:hypothetical protein
MNKLIQLLLLLGFLLLSCAHAQQDGVQVGSFTLFPTLGLGFGHDDNVSLVNNSRQRVSSNYTLFSPAIRLEAEGDKTDFLAQYDYTRTSYDESSRFDFDQHHFLAALGYRNSNRSKFKLAAEYFNTTDRIGTANQQGNLIGLDLNPDEWHSFGIAGKWHYGGIGSKGAIDLEVGAIDREYDNNRVFTASRDRETKYIGLTYSHQVSPKTNLLAQVKRTDIDYDTASLDSTETRLMFGAEWHATGKTSARALVGYLKKDFDDPTHNDFNGSAVEVGLTWSPKSYSIFDLTLNRETDETNGNGSFIVRNSADLGWTHFWKNRFSTTANIGFSDEDYDGSSRNDDLNYYGLSAKYQFNEWLMSGLGYKHFDRESSIDEFAYRDNTFLFTVEISK